MLGWVECRCRMVMWQLANVRDRTISRIIRCAAPASRYRSSMHAGGTTNGSSAEPSHFDPLGKSSIPQKFRFIIRVVRFKISYSTNDTTSIILQALPGSILKIKYCILLFLPVKFNFCRKTSVAKFLCVKTSGSKVVATSFLYLTVHR